MSTRATPGKDSAQPGSSPSRAQLEEKIRQLLQELALVAEERKANAEYRAELSQSRDRFADLYAFAPIGYLTLTSDGTIGDLNLAAASLLGRSPDGLKTYPLLPFVAQSDCRKLLDHLARCRRGDPLVVTELTLVPKGRPPFSAQLLSAIHPGLPESGVWHTALRDITDQLAASEVLRHSAAHFRALIENSAESITILDAAGAIRYQSPNGQRILGHPVDEVTGRSIFQFVHPDDLAMARQLLARPAAAPQSGFEVELRVRHHDGSWRWLHVTGQDLLADPTVAGIVLNARDVTERKEAAAILERRVAERTAELAAANASLAVEVRQRQMAEAELQKVNEGLERHVSERAAELSTANLALTAKVAELGAANERGNAARRAALNLMEDADAERRRAEQASAELRRENAERQRAEQAAREGEQELAAIYENAPLVMMLVDADHRIHKANKPAELLARSTDLVGRNAAEALGCVHAMPGTWNCGLALDCQHCTLRRCIDQTIKTGQGMQQLEFTLPLAAGDGRQGITFLVSARRVTIRGRPLALVTMHDITLRKQAEDVVERARAELEVRVTERTAQLRALAAELIQTEERERRRIAHLLHDELQQLLMAAKLRLEIMRGRKEAKPLYRDLLRIEEMIAESGAAARELSHELSPSVLHEYGLAAGLKWLGRWMHEKHGLTVRVTVETATDAVEPEVAVLLFQSVRELLFNVVKHAGVKRASVRIGGTPDGWLEIRVSDKGRGIKTPPVRTGRKVHAGLGLFGVRERLEFLGGRMQMESTPGHGCCFRLSAPLQKSAEPVPSVRAKGASSRRAPANRAPVPAAGSRATKRLAVVPPVQIRVLVVDDHQVVREGLTTLLAQCPDMSVVGMAADGREAIELVETLQPQVVIMDVNMPRLNGINATRRIATAWPHIKVIGLTMHADETSHDAMRSAGAVDCLVKSGPTEALIQAIRTAVPVRARRS